MTGLRAAFGERMSDGLAPIAVKLHFLDEIGMHLGLTRLYGRATPGERVVEATPGYSGPHYTGVAALTLRGVQAPWVLEGSMDGPAFEAYVRPVHAPDLAQAAEYLRDFRGLYENGSLEKRKRLLQAMLVKVFLEGDEICAIQPQREVFPLMFAYSSGPDGIRTRDLGLDRAAC